MSITDSVATTVKTRTQPRDVRGFWRILLAIIAPLPMLFLGVQYVLLPVDGDAPFEESVAAFAAHQDRLDLLEWLQVPFFVLLVPATFAVVWATRRATPRLTTAGALVALTGLLAGFGILGGTPRLETITVSKGIDVATAARIAAAYEEYPIAAIGALLFILGITVGLLLLGIALWRSHVAPAWMGVALALGGLTHPFIPGHVAQGIGLVVAAVGFAGASGALLRMRNDDFDLPAVSPARSI
jgi:hypothetical protein